MRRKAVPEKKLVQENCERAHQHESRDRTVFLVGFPTPYNFAPPCDFHWLVNCKTGVFTSFIAFVTTQQRSIFHLKMH